jgi:hypothetical protein
MEDVLRRAIERQARKLLERESRKQFTLKKYQRRFRLRTGLPPKIGKTKLPGAWLISPHFEPHYCIQHSKYLAKVLWQKLLARQYEPKPALQYQIPKDSGGSRNIMVFTIPDAAVANIFNARMRDRNKNIMSPFCYSYRNDRTLFDAVLQLNSYLRSDKSYIIQFDFSKYFDTIQHAYIDFLLKRDLFYISPMEKHVNQ